MNYRTIKVYTVVFFLFAKRVHFVMLILNHTGIFSSFLHCLLYCHQPDFMRCSVLCGSSMSVWCFLACVACPCLCGVSLSVWSVLVCVVCPCLCGVSVPCIVSFLVCCDPVCMFVILSVCCVPVCMLCTCLCLVPFHVWCDPVSVWCTSLCLLSLLVMLWPCMCVFSLPVRPCLCV